MSISVTPQLYRRIAGLSLAALCVIVFTGALVRLTGSGLGCADWPRCSQEKFVDVSSSHTAIEQVNRLFTGIVSTLVIIAVLAARFRHPRRRDLVKWSWSLVVGVLAQILLGGIVVLTGLNPVANMGHFLLSMALVTCGFILFRKSGEPSEKPIRRTQGISAVLQRDLQVFGLLATATLIAGTVVTATGPHAGDEDAVRFGFELRSVARVHSALVIVMLICAVVVVWRIAKHVTTPSLSALDDSMKTFVVVAAFQGVIGYAQYFSGVPVFLVSIHIAGVIAYWLSLCNVMIAPLREGA
ncbi:MAG: heme A synthase [Ilumatobacteraceae bacterium]|nr:heme A synthase [Ilumatobacteraceae bacterium]